MKVAHFVESYSPLSETFIYDKVSGLEKMGVSNTVYTCKQVESDRAVINTIELSKNVQIFDRIEYRLKKHLGLKAHLKAIDLRIYSKSLREHLINNTPDLIYAHFGPLGIVALPIAKELGIPILVNYYGYDISQYLKSRFWVRKYKKHLNDFSAVLGISNFICEKIRNLGTDPNKIHLIRLGVNPNDFDPVARQESSQIRCCFIGRLVEKKSPLDLIKSFEVLFDKFPSENIELIIIGNGPLYKDCKERIEKASLSENIKLVGAKRHGEAMDILKQSHIYVQHSITAKNGDMEGQGVTLVEASAMGIPVVSTKHNGFTDVVLNGKTGFLNPEKDHEAMASSILQLSKSTDLREQMGEKGIEHIRMHFNIVGELEKTILIFKGILQQ